MSFLNGSIWSQIAVPILVALVTTLSIEYFAKPTLDARRQRIIRGADAVDRIIYQFQVLGLQLGIAVHSSSNDPVTVAAREAALAEIKLGVSGMIEAIARLPVLYVQKHSEHIRLCAYYFGYLRGLLEENLALITSEQLTQVENDITVLDQYFRVYPNAGANIEPVLKRIYWRLANKSQNKKTVLGVISRIQAKSTSGKTKSLP